MDKKKLILIGGVLLTVLIIGGVLIGSHRGEVKEEAGGDLLPTEVAIPTVDSSVKVNLTSGKTKGEALLTIEKAPKGTKDIDFELSYNANNPDEGGTTLQGAIGGCEESQDVWKCGEPSPTGRKIVMGTCSSGVCKYHNVVGKVRLNLRFTGDYGDKVFEKEYEL